MATPLAGWQPLIVCNTTAPYDHACGFYDLVHLAQNLINDLIILSTFLAVAAFIYGAFKLLTSGGNEGAMKDAKKILGHVILGYVWILVAWLLVYTITTILLKPEFTFILGKP